MGSYNKKIKIITATGFGGTGSSAITDLLKEFDCGRSLGSDEFWFLQDFNGISDLEYYLIDGNHRSKVDLAIKRYQAYVYRNNFFYKKFFGNDFINLSNRYILSLIDSKFLKSLSIFDVSSPIFKFFIFNFSIKIQFIFFLLFKSIKKEFNPFIPKVTKYYSCNDRIRFYSSTKDYTSSLFNLLNPSKNLDFIAFDQLVPAINTHRYFNYVDNMKVIIVDRDPRDLYLLNMLRWKGASYICDTKDVYSFISWYRSMRNYNLYGKSDENILFLRFEDLVYNYESTLSYLLDFLNLNHSSHIKRKFFFNPDLSIKNTKLWFSSNQYNYEVKLIESELAEFCYPY